MQQSNSLEAKRKWKLLSTVWCQKIQKYQHIQHKIHHH